MQDVSPRSLLLTSLKRSIQLRLFLILSSYICSFSIIFKCCVKHFLYFTRLFKFPIRENKKMPLEHNLANTRRLYFVSLQCREYLLNMNNMHWGIVRATHELHGSQFTQSDLSTSSFKLLVKLLISQKKNCAQINRKHLTPNAYSCLLSLCGAKISQTKWAVCTVF